MSDGTDDAIEAGSGEDDPMEALARDVLPALIARLGSSRLGELEVATDAWRVRLRRAPRESAPTNTDSAAHEQADAEGGPAAARSPGVGYFDPGPRLTVGAAVAAGDRLGTVEVLGVAQEVVSPTDGIIGRVHVEPGQAVEYGQRLATIGTLEGASSAEAVAGRVSD